AKYRSDSSNSDYFTPFTYQNYDWYGTSCECWIVVLTDFVSSDLLHQFQSLLVGEYRDWCIRVAGADDASFGADHEIAVFSDQAIVSTEDAVAFEAPLIQ